jgi:WD domain, G-beta repeat
MARKKHSAEQIVAILRQIEVELANHKNIGQAAKVRDAASWRQLLALTGHTKDVSSVDWAADAKRLATGSWDETAKVWDAASG